MATVERKVFAAVRIVGCQSAVFAHTDGKEITPFMNRLKRDSMVYYNGHMHPNATIGESSDGQLIYMTGLLPLKCEITVNNGTITEERINQSVRRILKLKMKSFIN